MLELRFYGASDDLALLEGGPTTTTDGTPIDEIYTLEGRVDYTLKWSTWQAQVITEYRPSGCWLSFLELEEEDSEMPEGFTATQYRAHDYAMGLKVCVPHGAEIVVGGKRAIVEAEEEP